MKKTSKILSLLLAVIMLASIGLAGCSNDASSNDGQGTPSNTDTNGDQNDGTEEVKLDENQVLNFNLGGEPTSLDSALASYNHDFRILGNIKEGLAQRGPDNKILPGMAEKWDVSEDKLKYTFHLRDAKWTNGDSVVAGDFEFAWKLALNPKTGSQYQSIFQSFGLAGTDAIFGLTADSSDEEINAALDMVGVKALDEKTLEVTLTSPSPFFLELTAFATLFPINQKFYESLEAGTYATSPETMVLNGPFKLVEWNHDESIKLVKNDNYWDAATVKITELNFAMVDDDQTRFNLFLAGDLDASTIPASFIPQYKNDPNAELDAEPTTWWLYMNLKAKGDKGEYLQNINFRKALTLGINRTAYNEVVNAGVTPPAYGLVPPFIGGSSSDVEFREEFKANDEIQKENAEEAKALLQKAIEEVGKPLPTFEILVGESTFSTTSAQVLQEQWKQLGVTFTINQQPSKIQKELRRASQYDVSLNGWGADYSDPSTFMDLYTSDNPFNELGFNQPRYDELVKGAAKEADLVKRAQAYAEAEKIMLENYSIVPLFYDAQYVIRMPYVKDVVYYATGADTYYKWAYVSGRE